jgi:nicotinate phosphoribosyltransferase
MRVEGTEQEPVMKQDKPIIQTLMDTDRYKLSMQKAFLHTFPEARARYLFKCRNQGVKLGRYADEIREEVRHLDSLSFRPEEIDYLAKMPSLAGDYLDFLRQFRLDSRQLHIEARGDELAIEARGPLVSVMPFELYLLPIVQEVYSRRSYPDGDYAEATRRLEEKIALVRNCPDAGGFRYADFGGRRRQSREWHDFTVRRQSGALPVNFAGTSNMWLAMKYGLAPIGTMAHEYLQAFQAHSPRLVESQKSALQAWLSEFGGDLGIALTDVVGMEAFLRDLDADLARTLDGYRHDSGQPVKWTWKLVRRLEELQVDPAAKVAVYSDALNMVTALALHCLLRHTVRPLFGIGTHLTNDFGRAPLNLVMKMVECDGRPVAKISDSPGKEMCDNAEFLGHLMQVFQISGQAPVRKHDGVVGRGALQQL